MAFDTTAASDVLKEFYLPAIREQLNNGTVYLDQVEKTSEHVEGAEWVMSLHVTRNSGVGAVAENDDSPTAGNQGYKKATGGLSETRGRIQVNQKTISAMASDQGSYTRAVTSETKGVTADLRRDVNRQLLGNGDAKIATCGTTTTSATIVLATTTPQSAMRQLEVGMHVDIGTAADPDLIAADRSIVSVVTTAGSQTVTISGATVSTTASHFVFRKGAAGDGTVNEISNGLQKIVASSGSLMGVDPATYPVWAASVDSAAADRPINDSLLQKTLDNVYIASGVEPNMILSSFGVYRQYGNYLSTMKRATDTIDLKGGHKALAVTSGGATAGFTRERDVPDGFAFCLSTEDLELARMSDWEWMNKDGSVLHRVSGKNSYEATLYIFQEQLTEQRNAHGLVKNIAE